MCARGGVCVIPPRSVRSSYTPPPACVHCFAPPPPLPLRVCVCARAAWQRPTRVTPHVPDFVAAFLYPSGRCPSNDDPMTHDPLSTDTTDNNGVETDCHNRYDNGAQTIQTSWELSFVAVNGKGYVWVPGATTAALCNTASVAVIAPTAAIYQTISNSGSYGLCSGNINGAAATFIVSLREIPIILRHFFDPAPPFPPRTRSARAPLSPARRLPPLPPSPPCLSLSRFPPTLIQTVL